MLAIPFMINRAHRLSSWHDRFLKNNIKIPQEVYLIQISAAPTVFKSKSKSCRANKQPVFVVFPFREHISADVVPKESRHLKKNKTKQKSPKN